MKSIRRIFAVALLTSIFAFSALADDGIMHGDRTPPPPPPPAQNGLVAEASAPAAESGDELTATDCVSEAVQSALGAMFGLY